MQSEQMREKLFTIRMTDEERQRAERIAKHYGLNVAGVGECFSNAKKGYCRER